MSSSVDLLIVGASARAAAYSALRARLRPWCADLFGDVDLRSRCPVHAVQPGNYPWGLLSAVRQAPVAPLIYTGGLENRPALVRELAEIHPLWGNGPDVLAVARSPITLANVLRALKLPCPAVRLSEPEPSAERWLVKPLAGSGGAGIRFWTADSSKASAGVYFQEYIEGAPIAVTYIADGSQARVLGITRQLVGESWLHAAPFHYCGSIGAIASSASRQASLSGSLPPCGEGLGSGEARCSQSLSTELQRHGDALVRASGLRGLFGVDGMLRDGHFWPVEVNPRYTASVEVLEHALGAPLLEWHRRVFEGCGLMPPPFEVSPSKHVGKAIVFARRALEFPQDGPWLTSSRELDSVWELPAFADIPAAGQKIAAGRPILTLFARSDSPTVCLDELRGKAADLDRWLYRQ